MRSANDGSSPARRARRRWLIGLALVLCAVVIWDRYSRWAHEAELSRLCDETLLVDSHALSRPKAPLVIHHRERAFATCGSYCSAFLSDPRVDSVVSQNDELERLSHPELNAFPPGDFPFLERTKPAPNGSCTGDAIYVPTVTTTTCIRGLRELPATVYVFRSWSGTARRESALFPGIVAGASYELLDENGHRIEGLQAFALCCAGLNMIELMLPSNLPPQRKWCEGAEGLPSSVQLYSHQRLKQRRVQ